MVFGIKVSNMQLILVNFYSTPTEINEIFNFILNIKFSPSLILINFNDALNENFHETLDLDKFARRVARIYS